jgi:uncharacterized protein (TIGR00255 family)
MIYSMTAFSRIQNQGDWGNLTCELRSINHRYLEVSVHLPEALRVLEMPIREIIRQKIKRGKVDCAIRFQAHHDGNAVSLSINSELAKELCRASETIKELLISAAPVSPADILRFPGVLQTQETDIKKLQDAVLHVLNEGVDDLLAARAREGQELKNLFLQRMDLMQIELGKVKQRFPFVMADTKERLLKRFADAKLELDPNRLEQEMLIYAQKMDVAEELDRTETHISEVRRVLKEGGLAGRRLDFLLQELNREANTLGSKSTDSVLTHAAVEMKVLIEQVREQVQNVE